MKLSGSMVAIVTPMQDDGTIDKMALEELVEWHIHSKTNAIIVAGTTGESATLDYPEQFEVISIVVKQVAGRIPVVAGSGTSATRTTIILSENAKRAGAQACLIVTPYYNKPTQKGLYRHYKTVAEAVEMPIIIYNVPARTACDIQPETIEQLSQIKHIIGIKEASGKIERAQEIIKRCHADFAVFSGDDATALNLMRHGAKGVISVTANVAPLKMYEMCQAALNKQDDLAEKLNNELMALHKNLFLESNPIPLKWALHQMGKIKLGIRLPLLPLDKQYRQDVKDAMQQAGVNVS